MQHKFVYSGHLTKGHLFHCVCLSLYGSALLTWSLPRVSHTWIVLRSLSLISPMLRANLPIFVDIFFDCIKYIYAHTPPVAMTTRNAYQDVLCAKCIIYISLAPQSERK